MIKLDSVTKHYGKKIIFENLSYVFEDKGIYAINGASGSGKTSLLRMIAGLDKEYDGKITMQNVSKISFVFQEDRLIPYLTALKNVELVLKKEQKHKAAELFSQMGLENDAGLYPSELSGGMKRRVAIARALAYGGDVLLLDEAFTGIDDARKDTIIKMVKDYAIDHTVIIVSHDKTELEALECQTLTLIRAKR